MLVCRGLKKAIRIGVLPVQGSNIYYGFMRRQTRVSRPKWQNDIIKRIKYKIR